MVSSNSELVEVNLTTNASENISSNELNNRGKVNAGYVTDNDPELAMLQDEKSAARTMQWNQKSSWKNVLKKRIFILSWIQKYDKNMAIGDFIAGITLGLTMIPQAIAYAALAGLPSQYGLYSAFVGSLVYVFFGTIKEVSIGPTSLMALLTLQYTIDKPPQYAIVLAFLAGIIELLMGILRLGFVVEFISIPVTNAFTSATSLIIIGAQLKNLIGVKYSSKGFADSIYKLFECIQNTSLYDSLLGLICCLFLLLFRQMKDIKVNTDTTKGKILNKFIWYLSQSRNAIIVLITSVVAHQWAVGTAPFKLSGKVEPGIPEFTLPPFQFQYKNETIGFVQICSELGSGIIVVPLVAVLANVAIAKAFSTGTVVDATQEMLTLGICNILGSCFKSMPTCGAFTRSAVSQASGVRTPMAGLYSALLTILALSLLTPYFYFIPNATLAAVLVIAVMFMIDTDLPIKLWHENRRDFYAWLGTLVVCLIVGVELGLLFGVIINVLYLLYLWARPVTTVQIHELNNMEYIKITANIGMFFPGIDHLRELTTNVALQSNYKVPIVYNFKNIIGLDYTSIQGLCGIASDLHKKSQVLIIQNLEKHLQIGIKSDNLLFCNSDDKLCEILMQDNLRNGNIIIGTEHSIGATLDLSYTKIDDSSLQESKNL